MPPDDLRQLLIAADKMGSNPDGCIFIYCRFGPSAEYDFVLQQHQPSEGKKREDRWRVGEREG